MARTKIDPARRCLPFADWPERDREAWLGALRSGDPFSGTGAAAHWRQDTRRKVASSYGRWLTFLLPRGDLDPTASPASRATAECLSAWVAQLACQVASVTLAGRITDLAEALRVMEPGCDLTLLRQAAARLSARAIPSRHKRQKYLHPRKLLELGIRLFHEAEAFPCARPVWRAGRVRDALIIAVLASRAPRRRNLTMIEIGRHVSRSGKVYELHFEGQETKGDRPLDAALPAIMTPLLDRYLDTYRPILLAGRPSRRLWISNLGTDMAQDSIYARVCEITLRELGVAINPHAFRSGAPTAMAIEDPEHVGAAATILHQVGTRTMTEYYNLAQQVEAMRTWQSGITGSRATIQKAAPERHNRSDRRG